VQLLPPIYFVVKPIWHVCFWLQHAPLLNPSLGSARSALLQPSFSCWWGPPQAPLMILSEICTSWLKATRPGPCKGDVGKSLEGDGAGDAMAAVIHTKSLTLVARLERTIITKYYKHSEILGALYCNKINMSCSYYLSNHWVAVCEHEPIMNQIHPATWRITPVISNSGDHKSPIRSLSIYSCFYASNYCF
jgi:hypothetical protein